MSSLKVPLHIELLKLPDGHKTSSHPVLTYKHFIVTLFIHIILVFCTRERCRKNSHLGLVYMHDLLLSENHTFLYPKRRYTSEFRKQTRSSPLTISIGKIKQLQSLVKSSILIKRTTNFGNFNV